MREPGARRAVSLTRPGCTGWVLFGTGVLLALVGASVVAYGMDVLLLPVSQARTGWALVAGGGLLAVIGVAGPACVRRTAVLVIVNALAIEACLQLAALAGILPGISVAERVPWGRVYWTKEGFGNGLMNSHGFYDVQPPDGNEAERVVVIGDSFVEAVQVAKEETAGQQLQSLLREGRDRPSRAVISLGDSGNGPAQYLELVRHACRTFRPGVIVLCTFVGNDTRNASWRLQEGVPRDAFLYYDLAPDGGVALARGSDRALRSFRKRLELHRSPLVYAGQSVLSHVMSRHAVLQILQIARSPSAGARPATDDADRGRQERELADLGVDAGVFREDLDGEWKRANRLALALMGMAVEHARSKGAQVLVVSIPLFSSAFYEQKTEGALRTVFGELDLLAPERRLASFAEKEGFRLIPLGQQLLGSDLSTSQIKELYLTDGRGHFSPAGHRFLARQVYEALQGRTPGKGS